MKTTVQQCGSASLHTLRTEYLDRLPFAQELFLEQKICKSDWFRIDQESERSGYFVISPERQILEFYLKNPRDSGAAEIFQDVLAHHQIEKCLCKSFDLGLLSFCMEYGKCPEAVGLLFREFKEGFYTCKIKKVPSVRFTRQEDYNLITDIHEGIFDDDAEMSQYIGSRNMFVFELGNSFLGFGIITRVIQGRPEFDLGMLVHPDYRNRGYGSYIINYLATYCVCNGWQGVCGCDINNTASRKALEKAGFVSGHKLLEFMF